MGDLTDSLTCSICRNVYTDPVTLTCGHNFCRGCMTNTWNSRERLGEDYSCPLCCKSVMRRPQLTSNVTLKMIVDKVRLNQEESGIFCTYCVHSPVPASKTCLLCEASLCVTHLYWHSKSDKHLLTEPTKDFESKKCPIHGDDLQYYCEEDATCICKSCTMDVEHRGHQVEKLNEASDKRKESLKTVLEKLSPERNEIEERQQRLREHSREVEGRAEHQIKQVIDIFRGIRLKLEALKSQACQEIYGLRRQLSSPLSFQMKQLEIKKNELIRKIQHIEELCNMVNPIAVLQDWNSEGDALGYTEEGDIDVPGGEDIEAPALEQMDQVSEMLLMGLNRIVPEIRTLIDKEKPPAMDLQKSDVGPKTPCCSGTAQQLSSACTQEAEKPTVFGSVSCFEASCCVVPPMYIERATDITLDRNTAANNVLVSNGNKTLSYSETSQCYPESPERFQESQVLSSRLFASGQHYWEVEVSELGEVRIGVAYPSIARKGFRSYIGENTKSWCLYRYETSSKLEEKRQRFSGRHGSKGTHLPYRVSCPRLGVYLDCEAGSVSFYELCDQIRHLHTFTATFTEPLHAAFCVWGGASVTVLS
uniref:Uncharacterized protein n=1 Tax=Xenopus tropicalis TaxID=8364 RepID=A0A1B8Y331_XENTR|eukprot:XP_017945482.1 PREDICTED: E3 ubiquitin/ISG15 ligase TRIM25-like [Xenopus tropicalis]